MHQKETVNIEKKLCDLIRDASKAGLRGNWTMKFEHYVGSTFSNCFALEFVRNNIFARLLGALQIKLERDFLLDS